MPNGLDRIHPVIRASCDDHAAKGAHSRASSPVERDNWRPTQSHSGCADPWPCGCAPPGPTARRMTIERCNSRGRCVRLARCRRSAHSGSTAWRCSALHGRCPSSRTGTPDRWHQSMRSLGRSALDCAADVPHWKEKNAKGITYIVYVSVECVERV